MKMIELQEEGEFQKKLNENRCIKCYTLLKKIDESKRKCETCNLTIVD